MKQFLIKHALVAVLLTAIFWHTAVMPAARPAAPRSGIKHPDAEGGRPDAGSGRELTPAGRATKGRGEESARGPGESLDDLDWPEIIGG
jgi:hypothetical protein